MSAVSDGRRMTTTDRQWRVDLPYKRPPLNANQRLHWAEVAKRKKQIKGDVLTLARFAKLPTGLDQVGIVLWWSASIRRKRDEDNIGNTLKPAIDGLVAYGLVIDDDWEHVTSGTAITNGPDAVWLQIADFSEAHR